MAWAFVAGWSGLGSSNGWTAVLYLRFSPFGFFVDAVGAAVGWTTTLVVCLAAPTITRRRFLIEAAGEVALALLTGVCLDVPASRADALGAVETLALVMAALALTFLVVACVVEFFARERALR